jgi:hypothetical protein
MGPRAGSEAEAAAILGKRSGGPGMRLFSPEYYALCSGGGMLAAATTHLAITPLDVLKVNMQVRVPSASSLGCLWTRGAIALYSMCRILLIVARRESYSVLPRQELQERYINRDIMLVCCKDVVKL